MISAPNNVQVELPGALGAGSGLNGTNNSNSTASSSDSILPPDVAEKPWAIGSADGPSNPSQLRSTQTGCDDHISDGGDGAAIGSEGEATLESLTNENHRSKYQDRLFCQPSAAVESTLAASCETMGFDIAEVWLRTGPRSHQLINSHLRPTSLEDSVRDEIVEVYYGEQSSERTHRLSPALCKRAKEAMDIVWVTAQTPQGAEALRCSISDVRTAVAIPVCHAPSNTNMTVIFFSTRRIIMKPAAVEFLIHMSLASAVASVNSLAEDCLIDQDKLEKTRSTPAQAKLSHSEHIPKLEPMFQKHPESQPLSVTGARLDLQWRQLHHVEYLTDGGNSWIHTAILNGRPVVVKTLKPECQDVAMAINEIESELAVHARLDHANIVKLEGAGITSKGVRFIVLERLDGGTLTQMLGYDTRIRDRRRRFWRKKTLSYLDVLRCARSIATAMTYCQEEAITDCMVLHRDLKPDNIGFTLNGDVKLIDFGLSKIVEQASANSDDTYEMSGATGSLRYMAPEVADSLPYNHKADVYSFGIILWEMNACKKPFEGLDKEQFYEKVVHGGERPPINRKWPDELASLMTDSWNIDSTKRPTFPEIVQRLDSMIGCENRGGTKSGGAKKKTTLRKLSGIIDRHSTWF